MLKFHSLGDGNCLYNTEVVSIMRNFQEGNLDKLLNIKDFRQNMGKLLKKIIEQEVDVKTSEIVKKALGKRVTNKSVPRALNALLEALTVEGQCDWLALQLIMAPACRAVVIDYLDAVKRITREQKGVQNEVKKELLQALNQTLEIAMSTSEEETSLQLTAHFVGMKAIAAKIKAIRNDKTLISFEDKQNALEKWFFEEPAEGLQLYLHGAYGISKSGIEAGTLELKVLTHLFHHKVVFYSPGFIDDKNSTTIYAFENEENAKQIPRMTFKIEKLPDHWNIYFDESPSNTKLIEKYEAQRKKHVEDNYRKQLEANKASIIAEYGSLHRHHKQVYDYCTCEEYFELMGITKEEYGLSNLTERDDIQGRESDREQAFELIPQRLNQQQEQNEFDFIEYICMFLTIASVTAVVCQFLINPLFLPFMTYLFNQTIYASFVSIISTVTTISFSILTGIIVTEKYQQEHHNGILNTDCDHENISENEAQFPIAAQSKSMLHQYKQKPNNQVSDDLKSTEIENVRSRVLTG